jgi:hypothetical protein
LKRTSAVTVEDGLRALMGRRRIARLRRAGIDGGERGTEGFVVGLAGDLVMVHKVDSAILLDGYQVLRLRDVTEIDPDFANAAFVERALHLRRERPLRPPGIRLDSMRALIESAGGAFPLLTLHREREDRDSCWIGRLVAVDDLRVTIDYIDPSARWDGRERYPLRVLTKIEFGGRYEEALTLVAASAPARRKTAARKKGPRA